MNVVWWNAQKGYWDHHLLMQVFEKHPDLFHQWETKLPPIFDRAIVIVPGRPPIVPLKRYLEKLKGGTVILTSEEDSYFDWKEVIPKRFEIWTQYYAPNKSEIKTRLLLGPTLKIRNVRIDRNTPKKYLWSFIGQCQNPARQQMVEQLKKMSDGYLKIINGFGGYTEDGVGYEEYLTIMSESKYVICGAGSMCVDSFRVYEAMETGAIPITEMRSPRDHSDFNYWSEVYPSNGLILVDGWDKDQLIAIMNNGFDNGNKLPMMFYDEVYEGLPENFWWFCYKKEFERKLLKLAE